MTRQIAGRLQSALTTANYATTMRILQESEGQFIAPTRTYNWTTRLDYNHGERDLFSGRFTLAFEDIDLLGSTNVEAPSNGIIQKSQDYTAVGTWTHIFNDQLVNQLRVQFADDDYRQTSRVSGNRATRHCRADHLWALGRSSVHHRSEALPVRRHPELE